MATLREYLNAKIKAKGSSLSAEKAKAGKYKSIAAAKKAGALYYTDKNGKVMAAVYAEDLKKPIKKSSAPTTSVRPKARPKKKPGRLQGPTKRGVMTLDEKVEVDTANKKRMTTKEITRMANTALKDSSSARREKALQKAINNPGNAAARKALERFGTLTAVERAKLRAAEKKKKK